MAEGINARKKFSREEGYLREEERGGEGKVEREEIQNGGVNQGGRWQNRSEWIEPDELVSTVYVFYSLVPLG